MIKVWHNLRTFSPDRDKAALFPEHFSLVATVATGEPGEAYELTNSIHRGWWENAGVTVTPPVTALGGARSTSVGDVMELADGRLLLVKGIGFGEVVDRMVDWRDAY
jgi:hypothetical protein